MAEEIAFESGRILQLSRTRDLDLGSGHTAYRCASLIELYLHAKFHWNQRNFFGGRMYLRTHERTFETGSIRSTERICQRVNLTRGWAPPYLGEFSWLTLAWPWGAVLWVVASTSAVNQKMDFDPQPRCRCLCHHILTPAVTMTFDLQYQTRLSVGANEYSLSVLLKLFKPFMGYCKLFVIQDLTEWTDGWDGLKT